MFVSLEVLDSSFNRQRQSPESTKPNYAEKEGSDKKKR
jgi:hypothetical protein